MAGGNPTVGGPDVRVDQAPFNPMGTHLENSAMADLQVLTPPTVNPPVTKIMVQAYDQNIRYTLDGTAPTPVFGFRLTAARDPVVLTIGPNTILQFFEEAATANLSYVWGN